MNNWLKWWLRFWKVMSTLAIVVFAWKPDLSFLLYLWNNIYPVVLPLLAIFIPFGIVGWIIYLSYGYDCGQGYYTDFGKWVSTPSNPKSLKSVYDSREYERLLSNYYLTGNIPMQPRLTPLEKLPPEDISNYNHN